MIGRHIAVGALLLVAACTFTGLGDYSLLCVPGTLQCSGEQPQICNALGSAWDDDGPKCSGSTPACNEGMCVVCEVGALRCVGQQPQACLNGSSWTNNGDPCSNQTCVTGKCVGACAPGETRCQDAAGDNDAGAGVVNDDDDDGGFAFPLLQMCGPTGNWSTPTMCPSGNRCIADACDTCTSPACLPPGTVESFAMDYGACTGMVYCPQTEASLCGGGTVYALCYADVVGSAYTCTDPSSVGWTRGGC